MNENITVVVNGRNIEVKNGCVLVFTGGPYDADFDVVKEATEDSTCEDVLESLKHAKTHNDSFFKKLEESIPCEDDEEVTDFTPKPWGDSLDEAQTIIEQQDEYKHSFDAAVNFIAEGDGKSIINAAKYAMKHSNRFPSTIRQLSNVVNADDAYCSAIIKLARPLGKEVENAFFCFFKEAINGNEKAEECFLDMWETIKKINHFCGSFNEMI